MSNPEPFVLICPRCQAELVKHSATEYYCRVDKLDFPCIEGIWHFLPPEQYEPFREFIKDYETVRLAEGRASSQPEYYRTLPFRDLKGNHARDWEIRSRSYRAFLKELLAPLEKAQERPLRLLDLGAGNGWLSNLLALRGHQVAAVDLLTNPFDGLGTHTFYQSTFMSIQADFNRLPFRSDQVDLVIFNASIHYAIGYENVLAEALRVLRMDGQIVILDTPMYHDPKSGNQMVKERQSQFTQLYGFPSNAIASENYLTYERIEQLGRQLSLEWQFIRPQYGWRWAIKPLVARLRGWREPASFLILIGRR